MAFNVVNPYNPFVRSVWQALNALTEPLLRPIRRWMPDLGGIDISPVVLILACVFVQSVGASQHLPSSSCEARRRRSPGAPSRPGVRLLVRVTPKSAREGIDGVAETAQGAALTVRVRAVPEKGEANRAVEMAVADWLGVAKSSVAVTAGRKSRLKTVVDRGRARRAAPRWRPLRLASFAVRAASPCHVPLIIDGKAIAAGAARRGRGRGRAT